MKKVFISGKITGEPIYECMEKFYLATARAQQRLARTEDYENRIVTTYPEVVNPLTLPGIHFGISHKEAMKICFAELKTCTHIYMMKDWKESKGAKEEHQFAIDNGIEIIYE